MQFLPHNYLLRDPSRAVHHQVRLNYNDEAGVEAVKTFGGEWPSGEFDVVSIAIVNLVLPLGCPL